MAIDKKTISKLNHKNALEGQHRRAIQENFDSIDTLMNGSENVLKNLIEEIEARTKPWIKTQARLKLETLQAFELQINEIIKHEYLLQEAIQLYLENLRNSLEQLYEDIDAEQAAYEQQVKLMNDFLAAEKKRAEIITVLSELIERLEYVSLQIQVIIDYHEERKQVLISEIKTLENKLEVEYQNISNSIIDLINNMPNIDDHSVKISDPNEVFPDKTIKITHNDIKESLSEYYANQINSQPANLNIDSHQIIKSAIKERCGVAYKNHNPSHDQLSMLSEHAMLNNQNSVDRLLAIIDQFNSEALNKVNNKLNDIAIIKEELLSYEQALLEEKAIIKKLSILQESVKEVKLDLEKEQKVIQHNFNADSVLDLHNKITSVMPQIKNIENTFNHVSLDIESKEMPLLTQKVENFEDSIDLDALFEQSDDKALNSLPSETRTNNGNNSVARPFVGGNHSSLFGNSIPTSHSGENNASPKDKNVKPGSGSSNI